MESMLDYSQGFSASYFEVPLLLLLKILHLVRSHMEDSHCKTTLVFCNHLYQQRNGILLKERGAFGNADTGGAWLSSARAVRCWVKSRNERNPREVTED
ncbi:hypothetical protein Lal_00027378 [Lupinus albus]|nr:hypothetical protein Lal_00027378 [Lupinus albus]